MTPEGRVKKEIKAYLDSIGAYHVWPVPTGYGSPMVDCYACIRGQFVALEVKAPSKKATPKQLITLRKVYDAGGRSIVITDVQELKNVV